MIGEARILAVPREDLWAQGGLQGFSSDPQRVAHLMMAVEQAGRFVVRRSAEEDESLKQVVPYGVVLHGARLFLFQRGLEGAEAGLRGRWSVGLGGHVNPGDGDRIGPTMLRQALLRELAEEVALEDPQAELWGVLNDDRNPVGRRHVGFVYQVQVASSVAHSREPGKVRGAFVDLLAARARRQDMETWSRIVLDASIGES